MYLFGSVLKNSLGLDWYIFVSISQLFNVKSPSKLRLPTAQFGLLLLVYVSFICRVFNKIVFAGNTKLSSSGTNNNPP